MGESASASHFSVFGYDRNTSPFLNLLKNEKGAIVGKTYSGGLFTAISLPMFFNSIPYPNGMQQIAKGDTNLFNLAKDQGFQTFFYSAQARDDMHMINFLGGAWIDDVRFPDNEGYSLRDSMPDNKLLPAFKNIPVCSMLFIVLILIALFHSLIDFSKHPPDECKICLFALPSLPRNSPLGLYYPPVHFVLWRLKNSVSLFPKSF